jgi:hypothetical protein
MIYLTQREALRLMKSLACQILEGNANAGRDEFGTQDGEYISIAVEDCND